MEFRAQFETPTASVGTGFQTIEYPHIRRRLLLRDARALVNVLGVQVARHVNVGAARGRMWMATLAVSRPLHLAGFLVRQLGRRHGFE